MAEAEDKGKQVVDEGGEPEGNPEEEPEVPEQNSSVGNGDSVAVDVPDETSRPEVEAPPPPAVPQKTKPTETTGGTEDRHTDYTDPLPVPFWDPSELTRWSLWRAGIAEFVGSILFLYIGVQTVIGNTADGSAGVGTLGYAFAPGVTIFVLIYCIGGISGGHLNPAISFAFLLLRRFSLFRFLIYAIAQVLGALCGVGLVKAFQKGYYQRYGGAANFVHHGYSKGAGFVAELLGSFFLVYVVLMATDAKRKARDAYVPVLAPFAIGMTVFIVHLATIPITGTGISPARAFATASYWDHHDHAWHDQWIFWVAPLLGATVAAMYYQYIIRAIPFRNLDLASLRAGRRPAV